MYTHFYICTYIHIYVYTYIYIQTHTHKHTHIGRQIHPTGASSGPYATCGATQKM